MFSISLALHNIVRWAILLLGIAALSQSFGGWRRGRTWERIDRQIGLLFTISLDIQLLLGILLVATSPLMKAAIGDLSAVSASQEIRFLLLEHTPVMILAVLVAHGTSVLVRRADSDGQRYRRATLGYAMVMLLIMIAIPWWRPILPGLG